MLKNSKYVCIVCRNYWNYFQTLIQEKHSKKGFKFNNSSRKQPLSGAKIVVQMKEKNLSKSFEFNSNLQEEVDLVIWPESSTGFNNDPGVHSRVLDEISKESMRLNAYFLIGGDRPIEQSYFENWSIYFKSNKKYKKFNCWPILKHILYLLVNIFQLESI